MMLDLEPIPLFNGQGNYFFGESALSLNLGERDFTQQIKGGTSPATDSARTSLDKLRLDFSAGSAKLALRNRTGSAPAPGVVFRALAENPDVQK